MLRSRELAFIGIFTAFIAAATMFLSVFVAATGGFFNIGEIMVYTIALLMGPTIGAFSGGVGSMLADIFLGYTQFAPGTLVIKGLEGFIVGFLSCHRLKGLTRSKWLIITLGLGVIISILLFVVGTTYYVGELEFTLGLPILGYYNLTLYVPEIFWIILSPIIFIIIVFAGLLLDIELGWIVLSVLLGGSWMVFGYFAYERLIMGNIAALTEVPINMGQVTVGLLVSIPLYKAIRKILPFHTALAEDKQNKI